MVKYSGKTHKKHTQNEGYYMIIKGVIFDIDGTLIDSMEAWNKVSLRYLESIGLTADEELGNRLFALTIGDAADYIIENFGLNEKREEVVSGMNGIMMNFYKTEAKLKDGAFELLELLEADGIPMVIGTSTDRALVETALERLGIAKFFRRIFPCTEIGKSKAEPDLFLAAMKELNTQPEDTWLFEDGLYSLKTGNALGIKTVGVYDKTSAADQEDLERLADIYSPEGESLEMLYERIRNYIS